MRPADRTRFQKDAEAKFPIKVDIPVPSGGLGRRLTEMLAWCHANVAAGAWAQHGFMDRKRRDERGVPIDVTRWYFVGAADAEAFRRRWCDNRGGNSAKIYRLDRNVWGFPMLPLTKRMHEVLLSADLSRGTVNDVPLSTMYGLEARRLVTDEWRKRWSTQTSMSGRFPHCSGRLTEEGVRLTQSLREKRSRT